MTSSMLSCQKPDTYRELSIIHQLLRRLFFVLLIIYEYYWSTYR